MNMQVVNHRLNLSYSEFQEMGEGISFTTVGKYSIYEFLAAGGFGSVYKGFNEQTKQEVAIKLIDIFKINQEDSNRLRDIKLRLAKNEDLMMRICNSPNLVKCYDVYENDSLKLLMMEYCNGGSLQDYIDRKGRLSEKEAILIFKQILNGVAELHSKMIIHRDLKSENILIHNGVFKIADFGFSKQLEKDTNTSLGTITNMAPEVMKRQPYGLKADIWSLGVIMFQMVFGDFPFESREKKSLLDEISGSNIYREKRISQNGITASMEMSNFLRQTICINKDHRIGWKALLNHQIFKEKKKEQVPRSQVADVILIPPSMLEIMDADEESLKGNLSTYLRNLNVIFKDSEKVLKRMREKEKPKKVSEQDQVYTQMNQNLVQCLKIQLIYQQIISKIQGGHMLDMQQRKSIEFMYLLTTRCFLTISPINNYMSTHKDRHPFIGQTFGVVRTLYEKVHALFEKYSKRLTEEEDKWGNIIRDFFKSKKEIQEVDKFLSGIQNLDFNKQQQLRFIQVEYINTLKGTLQGPERQNVRKYLSIYTQINLVQFKHLHDTNFDDYIQRML